MKQNHPTPPLTSAAFYTLFALMNGEQHGYAIMQAVKAQSEGSFSMGPATLYTTIGRFLKDGLIEETTHRKRPEDLDRGRRYYRLTARGRTALEDELRRMAAILERAGVRKPIPLAAE